MEPTRSWSRHLAALLLYAVLAVALTWPVAWSAADKIPIPEGRSCLVPYHHVYMLAWIHHALDDGLERYWNANVFYPHRRTLTYSESFLAPSLLCWPIHLLTGNLTLCYNLVVLSSFFLNGVAVYLLALQFRLPWRAAVASGMAFAFCPYLFHEIYNPIMLLTYPAVFLWVCLHRLLHRPSRLGVVLAGFCSLWLLTTSYQYTLFCAVFCGIWLVWFARRIPWRRLWLPACVTGIVVLAAAWLWLAPVRQTHGEMGLQ